jgi:SAM-dependent methyltransferase
MSGEPTHCEGGEVSDAIFEERRLAEVYDPLEPDRPDLDPYIALVHALGARSVLDIGCGTGTFACLLAERGITVFGLDPAAASLEVARRKPSADQVRWILGDATSLPPLQVELVTMTGNVAQVFLTDEELTSVFQSAAAALRPGGHLVFEVRNPAAEGWKQWRRQHTHRHVQLPDVGAVETWMEVLETAQPLVTFRWTFVFGSDGTELVSDSTLRFWTRTEIVDALGRAGFVVRGIRDAPDRPGREFVYIAQRLDRSGGSA